MIAGGIFIVNFRWPYYSIAAKMRANRTAVIYNPAQKGTEREES